MMPSGDRTTRVYAEIDLDALRFNLESMKKNLHDGVMITAVIKANGYGHGAVRIAQEVEELPYLWGFAVATFEEAKELREAGIRKPILLLGYVFPYCYPELSLLDIRPAVFTEQMLEQLEQAAEETGEPIRIHIAVDTGMTRIGITPDERGAAFVQKAVTTQGLITEGIFTHFARADETERETTEEQFGRFGAFLNLVREKTGYRFPVRHCSNSAGIISYPEVNMDMVRAGITLYGLWPSCEVRKNIVPLKPVMSLYSHIVLIREIPENTPVSYGGTFVTDHKTRIATIPVGYADGYPRSLSGTGYVLIRGRRAPILGRICMDQMMVQVDEIPEAQEGDLVTLIGIDGNRSITMEELGDLSGRFNYELACDISPRVPRVFTKSADKVSKRSEG